MDNEERDNLFSAAGYLGPLCILPLFLRPNNALCQKHGKQGAFMSVVLIVTMIILVALPLFGTIILLIWVVLNGLGFFSALTGKDFSLPLVGALLASVDTTALKEKVGLEDPIQADETTVDSETPEDQNV